ncbi:MAG: hypothetical protein LBC09_02920 [Helicobacteraceae bacterium]|jgi:hypothetical protein|nr:hypothetical protein [Helicobacteraceae bacterium]
MNTGGLSLEQAPPFGAILRFFLAAPLFGVAAGALIAANGSTLLIDRFQPLSYALTHIVTIGLACMVMIGALFQMLPVVAGVRLPAANALSIGIFAALIIGVLALCFGFVQGEPIGFALGGGALFTALIVFAAIAIYKLYRVESENSAIWMIRLALIGLSVTVAFGAYLSLARYTQNITALTSALSNLHLGWGFIMWISMLIMGVARQVLPMFYVTPPYPKICCQIGVPLLYFTLIIASFLALLSIDLIYAVLVVKICAAAVLTMFGVITLDRIYKRKRKVSDPSLCYWRFAMCCLIASAPFLFIGGGKNEAILAILFIGGFALSLINAMIYKIIPFLSWFHLSAITLNDIPMMSDFISKNAIYIQMIFHCASIVFLIAGLFYDPLSRIGGGLFAIGYALVFKDISIAVLRYSRAKALAVK